MNNPPRQPVISHAEPVLAVTDLLATMTYWSEVLGFSKQWTWGDPPTHGGISWDGAFIQFSQNPARAQASSGNTIWIRVKYIDELYQMHLERKVEIVEPLRKQPWGMEDCIVKELNGYNLVFAGNSAVREKSGEFPAEVKILERLPTAQELIALARSVGWSDFLPMDRIDKQLAAPAFGVVAIDSSTGATIGCALLLTDHASFYYIKDVMVQPEWQKRRVGTALMNTLTQWLDRNAVPKSLVGLYTGENLAPFYRQFGFSNAFGMCKRM